ARAVELQEAFADALKELMGALQPIAGDDGTVQITVDGNSPIATTADGLRFSMRRPKWEDRLRFRRLHLAVECERHCGKDLWVETDDLLSVGYALDSEHQHDFGCLQQFDEYGEPMTDKQGNPLPPP